MQTPPVRSVTLPRLRSRKALAVAAVACGVALAAYAAEIATHQHRLMFSWYDLRIYNRAGLLVRHQPAMLYVWHSIRFTYTPFAALVFAATSVLPWPLLRLLMVTASVAALGLTIWLTFGGLGWRGRARAAATLGLFAVGFWTEPVQRGLRLGQVELLLMLLVVWDMTLSDRRWWKGSGIGVAAGIKLVPLIFIPYLVLAGKLRQAAVATAVFAGTVAIGFVFLPAASHQWWLTGYFFNSGNVGGVTGNLNQSLLGMIARLDHGSMAAANPQWAVVAAVTGVLGLAAAGVLHRSGQPVAGWVACALTGLLVSPISWDHHWLWVVPALAVLTDAAVRRRGGPRWIWWLLAGVLIVVYGGWPRYVSGPKALLPMGLLEYVPFSAQLGLTWVSDNLLVLAGLVMFAVVLAAAALTWRSGRSTLEPVSAAPAPAEVRQGRG